MFILLLTICAVSLMVHADSLAKCRDFARQRGNGDQQSYASYIHVCVELMFAKQPLVFGVGYDSLVYLGMNNQTLFVENNRDWIKKMNLPCHDCVVYYAFETSGLNGAILDDVDIPPITERRLAQTFDFMLIDGPPGTMPGRFQPLKFAHQRVREGSLHYVCLHDVNRAVEKTLFLRYFGNPDDVLSTSFAKQQLACKRFP